MVREPATVAAIQAMITVCEVVTNPLNPAANARGMVSPSISPMQMFLTTNFLFKISGSE